METVKKCSRCGLCAQVCPIFEVEKSEVALTRGKFLQLLGILRGELKFNKKIERNLRLCLNCGKCSENCPSAIDTVKLFSEIKSLQWERRGFGGSELIFNLKLLPIKLLNKFSRKKITLSEGELYFKGCLSKYNQKSPFKCCAVPFYVDGRLDIYQKMVEHNLKIIENETIKKVYFDCATCLNAVKNYPFKNPKNIGKLELLMPSAATGKFTFFKPCHLDRQEFENAELKFKELSNYVPFKKEHCCGFGGDFFLRHPIIAHKLSIKLAKEICKLGVDTVIAPCPTCAWSINWGLFFLGQRKISVF